MYYMLNLTLLLLKMMIKNLALQFTLNIAWGNFFHILDKEAEDNIENKLPSKARAV